MTAAETREFAHQARRRRASRLGSVSRQCPGPIPEMIEWSVALGPRLAPLRVSLADAAGVTA